MINLYEKGAFLVDGTELVDEKNAERLNQLVGSVPTKEEAKQNTIAYGILNDHNTSGSMDKLMIKFDTLTSHDITFVGIIQTARASGIEKFPVPYVLTNCRKALRRHVRTSSSGSHPSVCKGNARRRRKDDPWF